MSYSANLSEEVIKSQFLAVIKPRQRVLSTEFTLYSGSVYRASFSLGTVVGVIVSSSTLTAGSSVSLSAGQFYYDSGYLYIRKSDSTNPGSTEYIIATYEIYVGTFDSHWYRMPTDDTSTQVYFDARIIKSPVINQSMSDALFGYFPTKSTSIELANTDHFFEGALGDASFNKVQIKMWHLLGDESAANFRLVFSGSMGSVSYSQDRVSINILDQTDVFDQEYRHSTDYNFFRTADFPNIDSSIIGSPIRQVYGRVDGLVPTNIDYNDSAPTTSNNRIYVVKRGQSNLGSASTTVTGASSTTTVTYLTSAQGFMIGDSVYLNRVSGTDQYVIVEGVDYGVNTITHAAITGGAMTAGDTVSRSFVGYVYVTSDGIKYTLFYGRDYTESSGLANGCSGFTLTNNFEASVGMPSALKPGDSIFCRVYGDKNTETVGGGAFGSNDSKAGNLAQAVVILYKLMKTDLGIAESDIAVASFQSLQSTVTDTIGFSTPATQTGSFELYKDLISNILKTALLRLGKDNDDKWTLTKVGPLGSVTKTIEDDEISRDSVSYDFNYNDIVSDVVVEYAWTEHDGRPISKGESVATVSTTSSNAKYLHGQRRQETIRSLHYDGTQATTLASRYQYALGERRGIIRLESKNRFFDTVLGDVIRVSREKIPGYVYAEGTNQTADFVVIEVVKSLNKVTLTLDDQKGIEDNSGSW